jgi:DNA-binding transcriptional MocR family regulator
MSLYTPVLDRSKPLYLAIADAITCDVEAGTLPEGARLPPQRDLAWRVGVTLGTVTRAYRELESRGLMSGEVGRGSYVRKHRQAAALPPPTNPTTCDLSHAVPPLTIAQSEFDEALLHVTRDSRRLDLLDYTPPEGLSVHRTMGARWLKLSGISVEPEDVFVTAGAHAGLLTVFSAIAGPGEAIMAEEINYALLGPSLRNMHLKLLPLAMDAEGLMPTAFERAAKFGQSRILYLVPSLQNPTTYTMKRTRRDAIVSIARKYNVTLVEDDIFRLLDARTQPATIYSIAPERTFYVTGLSKTVAPGLRIGFVAGPQDQSRAIKSNIRMAASRSIGVTGEIARYWIETGRAETILIRIRNELSMRRDVFLDLFEGQSFSCAPYAPFAWVRLPASWSPGQFTAYAAAQGVKVTPGNAFHLENKSSTGHVRICFGQPSDAHSLRRALTVVRELLQQGPEVADITPVA